MKTEFQVEGMSCQHCVTAVTNAIREQDEGAQVQVDLEAGRVAVESTRSVESLKAAIDDAGYTVKAVLPEAARNAGDGGDRGDASNASGATGAATR